MKVMYVVPGLGGGGGAERSLASMALAWKGLIDLHVVALNDRLDLAPSLRASGATVTALGSTSRMEAIRELRRVIKAEKPDLVHSVLYEADLAARLATPRAIPISSSLVNVNYGEEHWSGPERSWVRVKAAQGLDAITAQRVAAFHALSTNVAEVMSARLGVSRRVMTVIPRGRDRSEVGDSTAERRAEVRQRLGVGDRPLLAAAARHEWQKGLDVLLGAVPAIRASVPDVAIVIGGRDGQETRRLHSLAKSAGLDVSKTFIGPRDDVPDLMCAADVWCVPSRWEGLGSILIEAMALGAPVLASAIPPILEIDPGRSWLEFFRPTDSEDLAEVAVRMLSEPADSARATYAVSLFEENFRSDLIADQMLDFFSSAARGRSRNRELRT